MTDFDDLAATWGDAEVTRFIGGKPQTREEVWLRLLRHVGQWALLGWGMWIVEEKQTGAFAGQIGFLDAKRNIVPSLEGMPEMGWVLAPQAHGKGYGTEAVRAAAAWGDMHFGKRRTCCIIAPENKASIGVAQKAGFVVWRNSTYHDSPTIIFVRDA